MKLVSSWNSDPLGWWSENGQRQKQMRGFFPFDKLRVRMTNDKMRCGYVQSYWFVGLSSMIRWVGTGSVEAL